MNDVKKIVILSTITALMLGSNAYAGKIITDPGAEDPQNPTVIQNTQFGFGGWNFENVNVKMIDLDGNPVMASFNTSNGTYTPMSVGMTFESDLYDITYVPGGPNTIGTTVMGTLNGKDWPVGEPAGIKIINDDAAMKHGKPHNCIMTSSYLEYQTMIPVVDDMSGTGYLDAWPTMPNPVICSSPWQTHKRYKIKLLPSTVEGITPGNWGKPVDVVFNLDPTDNDATPRRYQVLQKANNYTGVRLDGIKIEVLDENGSVNDALTLSLGEGEGDEGADIWDVNDMANMSHGLWGPYEINDEVVRFENGFFDYTRVYFDVDLSEDNKTIEYIGDMLGGNYQDLFGNWLPSIWEPTGVFFDEDQNPATDNILQAFLGIAPGFTERAWYKREVAYNPETPGVKPVYTWSEATEEDFASWSGEWYNEGPIEDVLNLGLNYIINVGLNADIGDTFTLRITPHVDTNQTPPSSYLTPIDSIDPKYSFEAIADFKNNDIADILWKNYSDGEVLIWYMNSDGTYTEKVIDMSDVNYTIDGVSDFNDDGIADILWRDPSIGLVAIWYMNSDGTYTEQEIAPSGITFNIDAVADFNDDGITDVLWRDPSTGITGIWYMTSDGTVTWKKIGSSGVTFNIDAAADFNDDGITDILWRNPTTGITGIWYMTSDGKFTWKKIASSGITYNIEAAADFNNDGIADVLWRDPSTGITGIWYMKSDGKFTWKNIGSSDIRYNIESATDFNNDGIADIFWRDPLTGDNLIWYMKSNGTYN